MQKQHLSILTVVQKWPGLPISGIQYELNFGVRNYISELINKSCIYQDKEHGYHLSPGGRYELGQTQADEQTLAA